MQNMPIEAMGAVRIDLRAGTISGSFPVTPNTRSALMATLARLMVAVSESEARAKCIVFADGHAKVS